MQNSVNHFEKNGLLCITNTAGTIIQKSTDFSYSGVVVKRLI